MVWMTGLNWDRYQTVLICGQATRDRERVVPTKNYSVTSLYRARVLLRIIGFVSDFVSIYGPTDQVKLFCYELKADFVLSSVMSFYLFLMFSNS